MSLHLVRVGAMGNVGRFVSTDATRYPRDTQVIVRTRRGLEFGCVLTSPDKAEGSPPRDGKILRGMTIEDHLLAARLKKNRNQAFEACQRRLSELDTPATLIDVELLFDGHSLFFYFLGEITPEIERITAELAELYEAKVKFRRFTEAVTNGCGPACGTEDASGGCSSCVSCAVRETCHDSG